MSNTPNYDLYLTDTDAISFLEWRKKINGTENSNMMKIDAALAEKADDSDVVHKTGADVVAGALTDRKDGDDGITPHIGDNGNWYMGDVDTGKPSRGADGKDGVDGKDGTDGTDGAPGSDGYSPVVTMSEVSGGTKISITDKTGTKTATIQNGTNGKDGTNGTNGAPGKDGNDGKSAYASAQDGGYTGTEAAFNAALAQVQDKADKAVSRSVTLYASSWNTSYKTQSVTVTGMTTDANCIITAAPASYMAYAEAGVRCSTQGAGYLIFQCETVPTQNLIVNVLILG